MKVRIFLSVSLIALFCWPVSGFAVEEFVGRLERPEKDKGPTKVHFFVFVIDVDDIDGAEQNFGTNVFVSLRWQDSRLADNTEQVRSVPMDDIWHPKLLLANKQGIVRRSMPELAEIAPDGAVHYRQRFVGRLSQPLKLSEFPADEHRFTIQFFAVGYDVDEVEFVPDVLPGKKAVVGGSVADRLSLQDWEIVRYESITHPYNPIPEIKAAGFAFEFVARRHFLYFLWQVVVPLTVIVMMSWASFWIDPSQAGVQIGVATSAILSLIAYRFVLANLVPRLPYMTRMDYFTLGSTFLVFFALVEVIATSFLARTNHGRLARAIDRAARVAFPAAFAILFSWSLFL